MLLSTLLVILLYCFGVLTVLMVLVYSLVQLETFLYRTVTVVTETIPPATVVLAVAVRVEVRLCLLVLW